VLPRGKKNNRSRQTKGIENQFHEIIAEKFPYLKREMDIQVQEAFRMLNRHDQKKNLPMSYYGQTVKSTEQRTLKCAREKHQLIIRENPSE
jgi:hypothetical protein